MTDIHETARLGRNSQNDWRYSGVARAIIGLLQGLALYNLFEAFQSEKWPSTNGPLFVAFCTTAFFVPLIAVSGLTHVRFRLLIGWVIVVALICGGLGYYDVIRDIAPPLSPVRNLPSEALWLALSAGLFIAHSLLIGGSSDRQFIARYPTYFDVSWKHGLQILLAILFAGFFWIILWLGAELFELINIHFLLQTIKKSWFWIPATALVLNYSLHITDVRASIIRGVRGLSCSLLSWLLPLMTLIAAGFILSLTVTGLEPLWNTRRASFILLATAASLVFLINSAYQDGRSVEAADGVKPVPRLLSIATRIASIVLVPLVLLAGYGILLRVRQYGWTPERVIATAYTMIGACYAFGYLFALLRGKFSHPRLAAANVATAFIILATLLALFTPIADPARISVADQIHQLSTGQLPPEKLDYVFLRFSSGRYGVDALRELSEQNKSPIAAEQAALALNLKTPYDRQRFLAKPAAKNLAENIAVVQPSGGSLPSEFLNTNWAAFKRVYLLPLCLTGRAKCDAVMADLNGDGIAEIILLPSPPSGNANATVFSSDATKSWVYSGSLAHSNCPGIREGLLTGRFELAETAFKELDVSGQRLHLNVDTDCEKDQNK